MHIYLNLVEIANCIDKTIVVLSNQSFETFVLTFLGMRTSCQS